MSRTLFTEEVASSPSLSALPPPPFGVQTLSFIATEDQSPRSVLLPSAKVREAGSL